MRLEKAQPFCQKKKITWHFTKQIKVRVFGERLSVCLSGELRCSRPRAQAGGQCRKEAVLGTQPAEITLVTLLSWVPRPNIAQGLQRQENTLLFVLEVWRICLRQREIPGFHKFIFYVWEINKNRACVRKVLECPKEVTWSHKHKINNLRYVRGI